MSVSDIYNRNESYKFKFTISLFIFLLFVAAYTITVGTADVSVKEAINSIIKTLTNGELTNQEKIIMHLRIPRIALAILSGAGLSLSGTVMQGITRNPLVSPFTVGISSAAAFGASLAIVFGWGVYTSTSFGVVLNAFFFAFICASLVYGIANKIGLTPETLILTGIALNYLFSAFTATIHFVAQEHQLASAIAWTFGSLNASTWGQVTFVLFVIFLSFPVLYRQAWALNAMSANDDEIVRTLGIDPVKNRTISGTLSVLITAAIISFTGVIGFVGLVAPHISRLIIGSDHRYLLPFSAVAGGLLVLLADTLGRVILAPVIIPVGIVVSYLGVPLFINLIITRKKGYF